MDKHKLLFYDAYEDFYAMTGKSDAFRAFCRDAFGEDFSQDGFSDLEQVDRILKYIPKAENVHILDKTTPRLIQFHTFINAVNPPFLGGFFYFRHCSGIGEAAVLPGRFLIFKGTL